MCGIVGGASEENVSTQLLDCIRELEYQGYDAANILVVNENQKIERLKSLNRVAELDKLLQLHPVNGKVGIANTNWYRRNKLQKEDAHPHIANGEIGIVQNGIVENGEEIRARLKAAGYSLVTYTDNELVGYLIYDNIKAGKDFISAIRSADKELEGAFSICIIDRHDPKHVKALHRGSNLVIGLGERANYVASDVAGLLRIASRFIYLEEGDLADISSTSVEIFDRSGARVERQIYKADSKDKVGRKGKYNHSMLKEIYDQPDVIATTLQGRLTDSGVSIDEFGINADEYFSRIHRIKIVASGTSFHAGLVGRYWMEEIAGIPCQVELADEMRYHERMAEPNTMFVTLSQSGESIETLNALRTAKNLGYTATLTIGNAPGSSLVGESDLALITGAGTGASETSIKDFSAQLTALSLLALAIGKYHRLDKEKEAILAKKIRTIPVKARKTLKLDSNIMDIAPILNNQQRALYLGNGIQFPVAMEGAMKLQESSSIVAQAYLADEFNQRGYKDAKAPIIALASQRDEYYDEIIPKVRELDRKLILFCDESNNINQTGDLSVIKLPTIDKLFSPLTYVIPVQLLAYHVAVNNGAYSKKSEEVGEF